MKQTKARIETAAMRIFAERGVTHVTVSELADEAGVARGTVYGNVASPDALFETIATELAAEMHARVVRSLEGVEDPAQRLANGVRQFVRRARDEPVWGRFITRFAMSSRSLQGMIGGPPGADVEHGLRSGRYTVAPEMATAVIAMVGGCTLSAMTLAIDGRQSWRAAGSEAAELLLRALGAPPQEAGAIARTRLPDLPRLDGDRRRPRRAAAGLLDNIEHECSKDFGSGAAGKAPARRRGRGRA